MVKHGLLICSFQAKKKYSVGEKDLYPLNKSYVNDDKKVENIFEMLQAFCKHFSKYYDDEKMMKMFAIDQNSIKYCSNENGTYSLMSCIVMSGAYGIESKMTNKDTKEVVYTRKKEDADVKPFQLMIYVPHDANNREVIKGILLFETIGSYGVKTITVQNMKQFISENYGLTLITKSISVKIFVEKLLREGKLSKITLINNKLSTDPSDSMFLNSGRQEKSYIKPMLRDGFIKRILRFIEGGIPEKEILEIDEVSYDDIKFTFSHADRTRTVSLMEMDSFSLIEDVPEYVYPEGNVDRDKLHEYMEMIAKDYAEKMIFIDE